MTLTIYTAIRHINRNVECDFVNAVGATLFVKGVKNPDEIDAIDGDVVKDRELVVIEQKGNVAKVELRKAAPLAP